MIEDRDYMREPSSRGGIWQWPQPSLTVLLVVVNVAVFLADSLASANLRNALFIQDYLALSLEGMRHGFVWQFLTFQFLHAGFWHLLFNCLAIFFFGRAVETTLGRHRFLALYLASGIFGGVLQMSFALGLPQYFDAPVVGASAGASGLVAAFAVFNWNDRFTMLIYFFPVNMRGRTLFWASAALAVVGLLTPNSGLANAAHLGGILTGFFYVRWLLSERPTPWEPPVRHRAPREFAAQLKENKFWRAKPVPPVAEKSAEEFLQTEVDPILDKISAQGIQSLTAREREVLKKAGQKINRP